MDKQLCVFACFALAGVPGMAQQLTVPDHYKCYNLFPSQLFSTAIGLRDQFDVALGQTEQILDLRPFRLCNPVEKTIRRSVTPFLRPELHYEMFQIPPEEIDARDVLVTNQFGRQELHTRDAKVLMAPTGKTLCPTGGCGATPAPSIPTNANHYKCYSASGKRILVSARLRDQFHTEFVRILEPILFCNPVDKFNASGANIGPIVNSGLHMTCYTITKVSILRDVVIANQFLSGPIRVGNADILCAPSQKVKWAPVPGLTAAGAELE